MPVFLPIEHQRKGIYPSRFNQDESTGCIKSKVK